MENKNKQRKRENNKRKKQIKRQYNRTVSSGNMTTVSIQHAVAHFDWMGDKVPDKSVMALLKKDADNNPFIMTVAQGFLQRMRGDYGIDVFYEIPYRTEAERLARIKVFSETLPLAFNDTQYRLSTIQYGKVS
jgi:hypothetical protein